MEKMTSAYANKLLKKLTEDKGYLLAKEHEGQIYVAALDEEPVIPEYPLFREDSGNFVEKIRGRRC